MVAFQELKTATSDSPDFLEAHWKDRDDLQQICDRLNGYSRSFDIVEDSVPLAFTAHVPAAASKARRDYDDRWRRLVWWIADREFMELFGDRVSDSLYGNQIVPTDPIGHDIEGHKLLADEEASSIDRAFDYISFKRDTDNDNDFAWADETQKNWERLKKFVGLDLVGAFWRRSAIPHVLFPSHVSNQYGPHHASIYRRLHDASRAFTFGAPLAALAMQRAVLEELLKKHWGSSGGIIRDANLPSLSHDARADRLKRYGNHALHGDPEKLTADELDREVIKNFLLLRELIEAAPENAQ